MFCPSEMKNKSASVSQANLISTVISENQNVANSRDLRANNSMTVEMIAANVDALKFESMKCAGNILKVILDVQMRFDKIDICNDDSLSVVTIVSDFGEREEAPITFCKMKTDNGMH